MGHRAVDDVIRAFRCEAWRGLNPKTIFDLWERSRADPKTIEQERQEAYELALPEIVFCKDVRRRFGGHVEAAVVNVLAGDEKEFILPNVPAEFIDPAIVSDMREIATAYGVTI